MHSTARKPGPSWTQKSMTEAVDMVRHGLMSVRKAASTYKVPRSTLGDRVSGKITLETRHGAEPKFMHEEERILIHFAARRAVSLILQMHS